MANEYATLAQLKRAVDPPITDTDEDVLLSAVLETASRSIDQECGRFFYQQTSTALTVVACDSRVLDLGHDLVSVDSIVADRDGDGTWEETWASADWRLEPLDSSLTGRPYDSLRATLTNGLYWPTSHRMATVKVTGTWGWPTVPPAIVEATTMLAARTWKRRGSPLGIAGFGDMGPVYVRNSDPDIARMLAPFKKWGIA